MARFVRMIVVIAAIWFGTASAQEAGSSPMTYTYYDGQVELGTVKRFHWTVLGAALERTRATYGDYKLVELPPVPGRRQRYELQQDHPVITVAAFNGTAEQTHNILPVRIPVDRGLLGYRVLLIREADQARFDAIRSAADLKTVRFGLMPWWNDVEIMRAAGAPVVEGENYDGLFRMLTAGRFDAFSRGISEVSEDLARAQQLAQGLAIEKHLLLHYPLPVYFWFTSDAEGRRRAERVRAGLAAMVADGSLAALFKAHYGAEMERLGIAGRRVIELTNPQLDGRDPLDDDRLWFHP